MLIIHFSVAVSFLHSPTNLEELGVTRFNLDYNSNKKAFQLAIVAIIVAIFGVSAVIAGPLFRLTDDRKGTRIGNTSASSALLSLMQGLA